MWGFLDLLSKYILDILDLLQRQIACTRRSERTLKKACQCKPQNKIWFAEDAENPGTRKANAPKIASTAMALDTLSFAVHSISFVPFVATSDTVQKSVGS